MKLIIIEGLDNTGKTTTISTLQNDFEAEGKSVYIHHCTKPEPDTIDNMIKAQKDEYCQLVKDLINLNKNNTYDYVIIDRCWYSEYVYGQIYRSRDELDLLADIYMFENSLNFYLKNNIYLLLLNVDNVEFSVKHEDGLSIAQADKDKISREQKLFVNIFNESLIKHKLNYIVNNGLDFKNKQLIIQDIEKFIKK